MDAKVPAQDWPERVARDIDEINKSLANLGRVFRCSVCHDIAATSGREGAVGQEMATVWKDGVFWAASRSVPHHYVGWRGFHPNLRLDLQAVPRQLIALSCRWRHRFSVPSIWLVTQIEGTSYAEGYVPQRFLRADPRAISLP